jgi:SAM-dependent methyltransferase
MNFIRVSRRAISDAKRAVLFGLSTELEWSSWAFSTRMGRNKPKGKADESVVLVPNYSLDGFRRYRPLARTQWLFHALAAIPGGPRDRLLIIGPRFANERFLARGIGFSPESISMLDTYSYSKHVDQGDMHSMTYPDNQFGYVVCGWTLAYSGDPKRAVDEMKRVLRPGGYLLIGMDVENASGERISGREDLQILCNGLNPLAHFEGAGNLVSVFQKPVSKLFVSKDPKS